MQYVNSYQFYLSLSFFHFTFHLQLQSSCCLGLCSWYFFDSFFLHTFYLVLSTHQFSSVQFSSVTQLCPTLCDPMDYSTPGLPVHHQLPELTQTHNLLIASVFTYKEMIHCNAYPSYTFNLRKLHFLLSCQQSILEIFTWMFYTHVSLTKLFCWFRVSLYT